MFRFSRGGLRAAGEKFKFALNPEQQFTVWAGGKKEFTGPRDYSEGTKEELLSWFDKMQEIRRVETRSNGFYTQRKIRGFCHLYNGQEAVCVGVQSSLAKTDAIVTAYRDHGWHLVRGGTVTEVMGEMFGNTAGSSKGKGGSMHLYNPKERYYGGNGIVGAQCPVGAGLAFKYAYKDAKNPEGIAITLYGDGAANQGQLYEAFNMAALWSLPVIFTCENNLYGMGTSVQRASANPDFYNRVEYIPGLRVDGQDIFAVREATRYVKEWAMKGNGPVCLEVLSYRYQGHSMSDPGMGYRSKEEVDRYKNQHDPIISMKKKLVEAGVATTEELDARIKAVNEGVDKGIKEAEAAPVTPIEELGTDISLGEYDNVRGVDHTRPIKVNPAKFLKYDAKSASAVPLK